MRNGFRIALGTAAVAAGLTLAAATPAQAQVRISGSFPLPHGRISIGIGDPFFSVGSCVPYGYSVYSRPDRGYGFEYRSRWIPVRRYQSRWVVCDPPEVTERVYREDRSYGGDEYCSRPASPYAYSYGQRPYASSQRRYDDYGQRRYDDRYERRDGDVQWEQQDRYEPDENHDWRR